MAVAAVGGCAALASGQSTGVTYGGLSAQRLPFTLTVDGQALSLDLTWTTTCGGLVRTVRPGATTIGPDGAFAWTGTFVNESLDGDEDRQRLALTGHRDADGALSGVWHAERDSYNGEAREIDETCSSGDVAFRVTAGGSTSPPGPQRDASGQLVTPLAGLAVARCRGRRQDVGPGPGRQGQQHRGGRDADRGRSADRRRGGSDARGWLRARGGRGRGLALVGASSTPAMRGRLRARVCGSSAWTLRHVRSRTGRRCRRRSRRGTSTTSRSVPGGVWLHNEDRVVRLDPRDGRLVRAIRVPADRRFASARRCSPFVLASPIAIYGDSVRVVTTTALHPAVRTRRRDPSPLRARARCTRWCASARARTGSRAWCRFTRDYSLLAAGAKWRLGRGLPEAAVAAPGYLPPSGPGSHRPANRAAGGGGGAARAAAQCGCPRRSCWSGELRVGSDGVWVVQPADSPAPAGTHSHREEATPGVLRRVDIATHRVSTVRTVARLPASLAG